MQIAHLVDLFFPLAGLLLAYFAGRVEERTLCVVGLCVFMPFYLFRFGMGQTVLDHRFSWIFFFILFHSGLLYIISAQIFRLMQTPVMTARLYLMNIMLINVHGVRSLQRLWGEAAEGYLSVNTLIFFHLTLFALLGVYISDERQNAQKRWLSVVFSPLPYALALGVALSFREIEIPYSILQRIDLLFDMCAPLALLALGLAWGRHVSFLQMREYTVLAPGLIVCVLLRLVASPVLAMGVVAMMGMEDPSLQRALILSSAAPTGMFAIFLAAFYRRSNEVRFTVLCIALTAFMSIVSVPLWEHLVNYFFPMPLE